MALPMRLCYWDRFWACRVIHEVGARMDVPHECILSAQSIFHNFYKRVEDDLSILDPFSCAMGSFFLAGKVTECSIRVKTLILQFEYVYTHKKLIGEMLALHNYRQEALKYEGDLNEDEHYAQWSKTLVTSEIKLLSVLGFSVYQFKENPHKYLLYFLKILGGNNNLAQKAWDYCNDAMLLDLCARFKTPAITASALYLAARKLEHPLPDPKTIAWYELMDTNIATINEISTEIVTLLSAYERKLKNKEESWLTQAITTLPTLHNTALVRAPVNPRHTMVMVGNQQQRLGYGANGGGSRESIQGKKRTSRWSS